MNILVTAIGSMSAACVISSMQNEGHYVVGCDIFPKEWHSVSQLCANVYKAPLATSEHEYIQFLKYVIQKEKIDILLPLTDLEIDVINQHRGQFDCFNMIISIQSEYTLSFARNKYSLYHKFKEDPNVPSIPTYRTSEIKESTPINYPCIAKPINGRSSEGLHVIHNLDELSLILKNRNYIVQERKAGNVFTVDYVRNNANSRDFCVVREELLRTKNGAGLTIQVVINELLSQLVSYIGNALMINGCVNMEFIYSNNQFYLIDINPRFSAGVAFSNLAGYNMVSNHINCLLGQDIQQNVKINDSIMCKSYVEEIIN